MKKAILICGLIFFMANAGFSQTVNGVNVKDLGVEYLEITGGGSVFRGTKIYLLVDYGQRTEILGTRETVILDSTGKKIEFNGIIDGLNFMSNNGYELVQVHGREPISYLMRKKKKD